MKCNHHGLSVILSLLVICCSLDFAQDDVLVVAPASEAAAGMDLKAVGELFKDSENLEEFEKALNDPELGLNNLDLDENGEVDFVRVVEEVSGNTHVIILQVPLAENEFQDVATIEVEKTGDDEYILQVHGDEAIYGANYYVVPISAYPHKWPVIQWIYRPVYNPYRSVVDFGHYPHWWNPYHPVGANVYLIRSTKFVDKTPFAFTKTTSVKSAVMVHYKHRSSPLVKKKTTIKNDADETTDSVDDKNGRK